MTQSNMVHKTFKFPKGCAASTITMRETNGIDEQNAAIMADARGERTSIYQELVRLSIVKVDGQPVIQPFTQLEQWNSVMRALVQEGYQHLNQIRKGDVEDFLKGVDESVPVADAVQPHQERVPSLEEVRSRVIAK